MLLTLLLIDTLDNDKAGLDALDVNPAPCLI